MERFHFIKRSVLVFLFSFTQILALSSVYGEPVDSPDCDSCFPGSDDLELRAELIYFRPTIDQSFFVINSIENRGAENNIYPFGRRHNNTPNYEAGYRLEAIYKPCNCFSDFDLRYTSLQANHSKSVSGDFLFDTIGFPGNGAQTPEDTTYDGTAHIKDHFKYYALDLTFNRFTMNCCPENLTFLFGLHYTWIRFKGVFNGDGTFIDDEQIIRVENRLEKKSHFWGIGPELGMNYRCPLPLCLCCNLGQIYFNANGRAALLCSKTKANFFYLTSRTGPDGVNIRNKALWRVNPTADLRLGLSYEFCYCGVEAVIEAGYEAVWYSDCVDFITGYDVAFAGDSFDSFSNLSMQGAYFAFGLKF
jgi:hypothetical protein